MTPEDGTIAALYLNEDFGIRFQGANEGLHFCRRL